MACVLHVYPTNSEFLHKINRFLKVHLVFGVEKWEIKLNVWVYFFSKHRKMKRSIYNISPAAKETCLTEPCCETSYEVLTDFVSLEDGESESDWCQADVIQRFSIINSFHDYRPTHVWDCDLWNVVNINNYSVDFGWLKGRYLCINLQQIPFIERTRNLIP